MSPICSDKRSIDLMNFQKVENTIFYMIFFVAKQAKRFLLGR